MTAAPAAKTRLGYVVCTGCGGDIYYRHAACQACGAANPKPWTPPGQQPQDAAAEPPVAPNTPIVAPPAPHVAPLASNVAPLPTAAVVAEPYVVMQDFRTQLGDVMGVFRKSMVLTDYALIQTLLAAGNPIAPTSTAAGLTCCPNCKHVFPLMGNATRKAG